VVFMSWKVFPGDERMKFLSRFFQNYENDIFPNGEILPIPVTRDGIRISNSDVHLIDFLEKIPDNSLIFCGQKNLIPKNLIDDKKIYDYSEDETFLLKNAYLTSCGAVKILLQNSKNPFNELKILISGFGRIGKNLTKLLTGLGTEVYVIGHSEKDSFWINQFGASEFNFSNRISFDFIVNTVPDIVFDEKNLSKIECKSGFIELASKPGVNPKICEYLGINHIHALGIPGKYYPESSAKIIKESILSIINKICGV